MVACGAGYAAKTDTSPLHALLRSPAYPLAERAWRPAITAKAAGHFTNSAELARTLRDLL
jgi:hypothetical protein